MRIVSIFSVFIFAFSLAVFSPVSGSEAQTNTQSIGVFYYGFSSGYTHQRLKASGVVSDEGIRIVGDVELKENGFFVASKLGYLFGNGKVGLEFEPRTTFTWVGGDFSLTAPDGATITGELFDGRQLNWLLPIIAVFKAENESTEFTVGAGTGVNIWDITDETSTTTSLPLVGKMGIGFAISEKAKLGVDAQFMYTVWDSDSDVDSIWSISGGAKLEYKF